MELDRWGDREELGRDKGVKPHEQNLLYEKLDDFH